MRNNEDLQRSQNKSSMTFVQNPPAQLKTKLCTWHFAPPINSATTVKKHAELTRWRDKTSHPFTTCDTLVTGMPLWYLSCSYRDDDVTEGQGCKCWLLWSQLVSCDFPQRCQSRLCTLRTLNLDPPWTIYVCIQCPAPEVTVSLWYVFFYLWCFKPKTHKRIFNVPGEVVKIFSPHYLNLNI